MNLRAAPEISALSFSAVSSAYVCALQKEVPYHGRLYITEAHACFYSSVLLKDTKVNTGFICLVVDWHVAYVFHWDDL